MSASYPGNPSLSADIKEKVLTTFRQSIALFKQGRKDEAVAGCQFVMQLDAAFQPARKLMEKAKNPAAPIDVDSLLASVGPAGTDSLAAARAALTARDFDRAVELSQAVLASDMTNAEAQKISAEAQAKLEAQPFIAQFLDKAKKQRTAGNESAAKQLLDKVRSLDATHPGLRAVETKAAEAPMSFDFGAPGSSAVGSAFSEQETSQPSASPFDLSSFTPGESSPPPSPPASSDSFVVGPPEPSPPSAEASAFGFTFEEDAKPEPAVSPPAPTIVPGSASTFDFGTASLDVSADDKTKIARYLEEGDAAFDSGEFQKAIDLWSRIFLIDVTHEEASARIDRARERRVATDKQVETLVEAGTEAFERGDRDTARTKFEEAIRLDPTNFIASEYLERLSAGAAAPEPASIPLKQTAPAKAADDLFEEEFDARASAEATDSADIRTPPAAARTRTATPARAQKSRSMTPLILIVVAVLVLGVGGWFGLKMLGGGDGNGAAPADSATFDQAQSLSAAGQFDQAISLLSAIRPSDPEYDRALAMIADLQRKRAQAAAQNPAQQGQSFSDLVSRGQAAFAANDYVTAKRALEQAASMQPLPADLKAQLDTASQQVGRLQSASVMFKEGNYRDALASLLTLQQQDPRNQNVRQMILDAHFNLGQLALQEEKTVDAITHFDQVLAVNPEDELARRSRDLAARYNNERKDLLYRIFVKHLPQRGV